MHRYLTSLNMNFWENKIGDFQVQRGVSSEVEVRKDSGESVMKLGHLLVDVYQDKQSLVLLAPVPGVKHDDVDLQLQEDILTIVARRSISEDLLDADFLVKECYWGEVRRAVVLPEGLDLDSIEATIEDGLLKVRFKKNVNKDIKKIVI